MTQISFYVENTGNIVSQSVLVPVCLTVEQNKMIQQRNNLFQQKLNQRNSFFWSGRLPLRVLPSNN